MRVTLRVASVLLLGAAAHAAASSAPAQTGDPGPRIDALVASYAALGQFSGAALVASGGKVVFSKGFGEANREWAIPNAPDTRFRIGSVTKQFTATLVMQLVEQGKLSLDARLVDVLPWYRQDTGAKVRIRNLLNHTSGIPNVTDRPEFQSEIQRRSMTIREEITKYCSDDLQFEPGSQFRYSNSGYVILGAVIEQITGMPYERALRERILDPAGMKATGYDHNETILPKRASGYQLDLDTPVNAPFIDMSLPAAAGALYSTVEDLYRWDQALHGTTVLSETAKAQMFTPGLQDYGFGWRIRKAPIGPDKAERTRIEHAGGINGFSALIVRVPEDRHLVVLLANDIGSRLGPIATGALDVLYGRQPEAPRPSIADEVRAVLDKRGLEAAVARYREAKATQADVFTFGEGEMNRLGYVLLQRGRADDAIAIFALNVEAFPQSGNVYDSLAEAYMTKGERELAIKNYAKSLELDPGNANAVRQLQILVKR